MPRRTQHRGVKGSLKWIQYLVNDHPSVLDQAIGFGPVRWHSPLASDQYAEYWDADFLDLLGVRNLARPLDTFWPRSGPRWDALGVNKSGALVLVEAKAHADELQTASSAGPDSLVMIERAFAELASAWGVQLTPAWTTTYYQYANRLAHAFFLNELNARPAILAFVNCIGDVTMHGPTSRQEWEDTIESVHRALGVENSLPPYVTDAFVDVGCPTPIAA